MNELTVFQNNQFGQLRIVIIDNSPWFVARDVCKALDLDRTAIRRLDDDERGVCLIHTPGGTQNMSIVSEPGLYSLVIGSRKPEAHQFKRWVTHDVLPAIRKTGSYNTTSVTQQIISDPQSLYLLVEQLRSEHFARIAAEKSQKDTIIKLSEANAKLDAIRTNPVFIFPDDPNAKLCCSVAELACRLSSNTRHISRSDMFSWFRQHGYIRQDSPLPTSSAISSGLFTIIEKRSGRSRYYTAAVTLSGQLHFVSVFNF